MTKTHLKLVAGTDAQTSATENESLKANTSFSGDHIDTLISSGLETEKKHDIANTDDLYPDIHSNSLTFSTAIGLLAEVNNNILNAISSLKDGENYESDDFVIRCFPLLPELFCCRDIGDGYSAIIVALNYSLKNKQGEPLEIEELTVISKLIRRLISEPFISHSEAIEEICKLENFGFCVEPRAISAFMDDDIKIEES